MYEHDTPAEKVRELRETALEILQNEDLQDYCAEEGSLQVLPAYQGNEGEIKYLHVGYAANERSRETFGEDVGEQLSLYTKTEFGSLSLNSILHRSGGIESHAEDPAGTAEDIEQELEENIGYHMPREALADGRCDDRLGKLGREGGVLDPDAVEQEQGFIKEWTTLTPEYLESKVEEAYQEATGQELGGERQ